MDNMNKEKEMEVKVLNIDLDQIEEKLKDIGAQLISDEYQVNTVFDSKDQYIEKDLDSYLRIRESKNRLDHSKTTELTLKKTVSRQGTRKNIEITTNIDKKESLILILEDLKYHVVQEGYKDRKSYIYDNIRFDLDRWDTDTYPYPYMEIEVEKEEDLEKAIKLLNLDKSNITTKSITELREEL